ncbi:MAG: hypothetical protein E7115_07070 [Bacteroidales bacterium]|nr:hypothetical protein [Bacteroidales bacterium]
MKRIFFILLTFVFIFGSCTEELGNGKFSVAPENLKFAKAGDVRTLVINTQSDWTIEILGGDGWLTASPVSGRGIGRSTITASMNPALERTATINVSSGGTTVSVAVTQEGLVMDENIIPDAASGVVVDPVKPDADGPCTIKFNAPAGSELFGYTGELYAHLGLIVDDEWAFVPADWDENTDKCKFTNVGENSWELKIEPSIREFFGSGETPLTRLAIVIRSADGSLQTRPDQFNSIKDNKYQLVPFVPDPVVDETMPADLKHGINIHDDNSVTFVLYAADKDGAMHDYCYLVGDWNNFERVPEGIMKRDAEAGCWWLKVEGFDPDQEYRYNFRLGNPPASDIVVSDPYTEIVYDQWNDQYIDGVPAFPEGAKALVSAFQINKPVYNWKHSDFKVEDKNDLVIYEMHFRDFTTSQNIEGAMAQLDYIENLGVNAVELMPIQEFDGNNSWGYNPNHWFALDKYYGTREEYKAFIDECHARDIAVIVDVVYNHATGSHTWAKMWWDGDATADNNPWFNRVAKHEFNVYHDMNHENAMVREHVKQSLEYLLTEYDVDGFRFDLTKGFTQKNTLGNVGAWGRYDPSRVDILKDYADHVWSVNNDAVVIFEHLSDWDEEKALAEHGIQLWRNVNHEYRTAVTGGSGDFTNMYSNAPFGGFVGYMESHDEERICYGATSDNSSVTWGICGSLTSWGETPDITMNADGAFFVAKNVSFAATDMFKIRGNNEWNDAFNYGSSTQGYKLPLDKEYQLTLGSGSKDMAVPAAGSYDVYFSADMQKVWLMTVGKRPADPTGGESEDALTVAMRRAGASAAFFLTVPGPKMIWQFGEIGYDYSIDYNDRVGEKPVVTDKYLAVPARKALYDTYAVLLKFRRENPRFFDSDASFKWTPNGATKTITCSADGKTFHIVGNFGSGSQQISVELPHDGNWYNYFNRDEVWAGQSHTPTLKEGEFVFLVDWK